MKDSMSTRQINKLISTMIGTGMTRDMKGTALVSLLVLSVLISAFSLADPAEGGTRIGRSDFTIWSVDVDPDLIGYGILEYPDTYSNDDYKNEQITMDVSDDVPEEGDIVHINLTVFNLGLESGSADVEFYDGPKDEGYLIGTDRVHVDSFSYDVAYTGWDTEGIAGEEHDIFAYLIPDDPANETDQENNNGSRSILINFYPVSVISGYSVGENIGVEVMEGDRVTFDGSGSDDTERDRNAGLVYEWDFRDINSNVTNPVIVSDVNLTFAEHTFGDSGSYKINLKITDQHGASRNSSVIMEVENRVPEPVIGSTFGTYQEDEEIKFHPFLTEDSDHDLSLMDYRWSFGDGNTTGWMEGKEVYHVYERSGIYTIILEARDDEGEIGRDDLDITIYNVPPIAIIDDITVNGGGIIPVNGEIEVFEDDIIHLSGASSFDTPSDIDDMGFEWFIDGILNSEEDEMDHSFFDEGNHLVSLKVSDDAGSVKKDLSVIVRNMVPIAEAGEGGIFHTSIIRFDGSDSRDTSSDRQDLLFMWDLGDGNTREGEIIEHEYAEKGTYIVELTVTDDNGDRSTDTVRIVIENLAPEIDVIFPDSVAEDEIFMMDASASLDPDGDILSFIWDFSDGSRSSGILIDHVFHHSGREKVILSIIDDNDAVATLEFFIDVLNFEPVADAGGDNETVIGRGVLLDGSMSSDSPSDRMNLTYVWVLHNGTILHGKIVEIFFDTVGEYEITLKVIDPEGLESMDIMGIWVWGSILKSIDIDLDLDPSRCEPGEIIHISGVITYDLGEIERDPEQLLPPVLISLDGNQYHLRTSRDGYFGIDVTSPMQEGDFEIICSVTRLGVFEEERVTISVVEMDEGMDIGAIVTSPVGISAGAGLLIIGGAGAGILSTDIGRWKFFTLLIPLYSRIRRDKVLDNFERGRIYQYIVMNPGDYYSNIKRMLEINNGTLTYHLKVLEQKEYIKSRTEGNQKRFYPYGMKVQGGPHRDIQDMILETLYIHPGMSQREIAQELGVHVSTVNYHINMMVGAGILDIHREDRVQRYVVSYIAQELPLDTEYT